MLIIVYLYIFIIGLIVGSFINAYEYRVETEQTIKGRSFCPNCKHQLAWFDLIPIISWLYLKGKCRYCKKQISFQYPVIEFLTGISFLIISAFTPYLSIIISNLGGKASWVALISLVIAFYVAFTLIFNSLYDYKTGYLLTKHIYIAIALVFVSLTINYAGNILSLDFFWHIFPNILSAVIPASLFLLLSFVSRERWMGWGDADLVFLIGIFLGFPNIVIALYFAFIVGTIFGLAKIIKYKSRVNSEVPFGPMLVAGAFFSLLFGSQLANLYVKIFLGG